MANDMEILSRANERRPPWLMPWNWSRWFQWTFGILIVISPALYLLSVPPLILSAMSLGYDGENFGFCDVYFGPASWMADHVPGIQQFMEWELFFLLDTFPWLDPG